MFFFKKSKKNFAVQNDNLLLQPLTKRAKKQSKFLKEEIAESAKISGYRNDFCNCRWVDKHQEFIDIVGQKASNSQGLFGKKFQSEELD